ncbi:Protein ABHD8 [Hondaea fermentalgiana]|uniref:Protein ABHD8 n=1 Tax=Hondaea fermentalgiana TaxID=2315210 RepID=A0A2R5GJF0_9STRA|nr:Protein ABHD8 [Hondaea fermentalgiana]|eukprot:GBG31012.1 Protein ABHD8 [Hondaea fermentalgiana]
MPFCNVVNAGEPAHRIWYEVFGASEDEATHRVFLTMGMGCDLRPWEPQIDYFVRIPGYRVVAYDNRGMGHSDHVPGRWTTRAMAKDGLAVLRHIGWSKDIHLVGVSMGGMITQELAFLDLERFASVTLLSTIAGGIKSLLQFITVLPTGIFTLLQSLMAQTSETKVEKMLQLMFPSTYLEALDEVSGKTNADIVRSVILGRTEASAQEGRKYMDFPIFVKQALAVMTHRVPTQRLKQLGSILPVLVVSGDSDILVPDANSHLLAREIGSNAELLLIPGAGHGASEQCADEVNPAIRNLIEVRARSKL